MKKRLFVSAVAPELLPLATRLGATQTPWGWETAELRLLPLGIGPLNAQLNLLTFDLPTSDVWFVGTAGFFTPTSHHIGDLVQARSVCLFDGAALLGHSHFACQHSSTELAQTGPTFGLKSVLVANSLCVTSSDLLAQKITTETQAEVENLELYGVAQAAQSRGLAWSALLGLTNQVGPDGGQQWAQNQRSLAEKSARFLAKILEESGHT